MPNIIPIPLPPIEDYSQAESLSSCLSSLEMMVKSFDESMKSLESNIERHSKRIRRLSHRCQNAKRRLEKLHELGERGKAVCMKSPSSLPSIRKEHGEEEGGGGVLEDVRSASNRAVLTLLDADRAKQRDASISDGWLDRASGFEETNLCNMAEESHTIPSLLWNIKAEEEEKLARQRQEEATTSSIEEDTVLTTDTILTTSSRIPKEHPASTSRQQAASASHPFLCELLHDVYGVGANPSGGDAGELFPPPRHVGELMLFHSKNNTLLYTRDEKQRPEDIIKSTPFRSPKNNQQLKRHDETTATPMTTPMTTTTTNQQLPDLSSPNFATYRPENVSNDAALFELPEDLPLPDVARMKLDREPKQSL